MSEKKQGFCPYCQRLVLGVVPTVNAGWFVLGVVATWVVGRFVLGPFATPGAIFALIVCAPILILKNRQIRKAGPVCPTCGTLSPPRAAQMVPGRAAHLGNVTSPENSRQ